MRIQRAIVIPMFPQLHYFTDRPMSGLVVGYAEGVFDDDEWRRRNLRDVMAYPPDVLVLPKGSLARGSAFRRAQPELSTYLQARFQRRLAEQGDWLALIPAPRNQRR